MSKPDGGPAFPYGPVMTMNAEGTWPTLTEAQKGMTLRDYFAAAALQAHIAGGVTNGAIAAESSYRYADAMLLERAK